MALSLMAVWFLIGETHRGQQLTPALTLPQVRYGLSLLLIEAFCTPSIHSSIAKCIVNECAMSWPESTIIVPATACHHGSYVETYSRSKTLESNMRLAQLVAAAPAEAPNYKQ